MVYNLYKTAKAGSISSEPVLEAYALDDSSIEHGASAHRKLEGWPMIFAILSLLAILVGSAIEIVPAVLSKSFIVKMDVVKPYTPLELIGRDIYIREGCYLCHSQTVRPMAHEVLRYGKPSEAAEFVYDHPFQWGSKRTGPDLARLGQKYPNMWHYRHMYDPREVTAGSIMPNYKWLFTDKADYQSIMKKMNVMKTLGVPYSQEEISGSLAAAKAQAEVIKDDLVAAGVPAAILDKEIIPLIAYLQRIGVDYGKSETPQVLGKSEEQQ
jgi:cytochrome c oxidase cbb3-type subunit I/II